MVRPMTPDQMLKALRDEGLTVIEVPGWRDRCRCCPDNVKHRTSGRYVRPWGDVVGLVNHITGGGLGKRTVPEYIRDIINGDPVTPTKSQIVTAPNGDVYVNSAGRCNHAGKVGSQVKTHLRLADFSLTDDHDDRYDGASADGNAFTYGNENIAAVTMTEAQRASSVKIFAAFARFYGWTGQESVGHGEISLARSKADPNLDMGKFRRDVMARVKAGTKPTAPTTPKPTTPPVTTPATTYVVKPGDTLGRIAKDNSIDIDVLASWNGITDRDVIRVGQLLTLVKPAVVPPLCPVPDPGEVKPPVVPSTKYAEDVVVALNGAAYNAAKGKATALKRLPAMAASLKADRPAVAILCEWSHPMLELADELMAPYQRGILPGRDDDDANGAGREVYVREDMRIVAVVKGDVETKLQLPGEAKPDDKPIMAVVYEPRSGGLRRLGVAFHNENQDGRDVRTGLDADTIRVRQMREDLEFAISVADDYGVPYYNIDVAGDGNSYDWALDEAEDMNWKSALKSAAEKGDDVALRTHNEWDDERVEAGHFDLGLVRHYVDVLWGDQTFDPSLSDHNKITYRRRYLLAR